jgi:hypothetical protein
MKYFIYRAFIFNEITNLLSALYLIKIICRHVLTENNYQKVDYFVRGEYEAKKVVK